MNNFVISQPIDVRKSSYICRMFGPTGMTFDIVVDGQAIWTAFDSGEAKQFCLDHKLSTRINNFRTEKYQ